MTPLRYIAELAEHLAEMAREHGTPLLSYLMEMAAAQAEKETRENEDAEGEPCLM